MSPGNSSLRQSHRVPLWEYLLAVRPDEIVQQKILQEKMIFHSQYDHERFTLKQPDITIASFLAKEMMEETLIRWIQNLCRLQQAFCVRLNNYNGNPDGTIYLRIQDPKCIVQLANAVRIVDGFLESNECPPLSLVKNPYLAIAAGLPSSIYEKAIVDYARKSFSESFKVEKLMLLKREGEHDQLEIVNTFTLSPAVE
jgi:hypothetical protein